MRARCGRRSCGGCTDVFAALALRRALLAAPGAHRSTARPRRRAAGSEGAAGRGAGTEGGPSAPPCCRAAAAAAPLPPRDCAGDPVPPRGRSGAAGPSPLSGAAEGPARSFPSAQEVQAGSAPARAVSTAAPRPSALRPPRSSPAPRPSPARHPSPLPAEGAAQLPGALPAAGSGTAAGPAPCPGPERAAAGPHRAPRAAAGLCTAGAAPTALARRPGTPGHSVVP